MRVTMNTMYERVKTDLDRLTERLNKYNAQISSGKIYQTPSDAPIKLTHALGVRDTISNLDQFKRNISYGKGWLAVTENTLRSFEDRLQRAKELAIQGANDTQNADTRRAIATEVKSILEELVSLGNTKFGNRFVFAGTKTNGSHKDEMPFQMDYKGNVIYTGNTEDISINVAPGIKEKINLDGKGALIDSGAFKAVKDLYDSLMADSQPNIENAIDKLDKSLTEITNQIGKIGSMENSLEVKEDLNETGRLTNKEILSNIEDADMIEAISSLNATQTAYQAALGAASKIMKVSLADYL